MRYGNLKTTLTAVAILAQFVSPVQQSQAGPIIDWLFHRTPAYTPTNVQPIYGQPGLGQPSVSYGNACDPCGQQLNQRVVANYMPETYFRTTWVQVPVTNYRPVSSVDPGTCCPVTTLRPCTTYMWQARRVPSYTTFRPVYTAFAAPFATTACAPISSPGYGGGCSSCGVSTPAAAPYYAPSTTMVPGTVLPGTSLPGSGLPTTLGPGVPTPADMQPRLTPGGVQRSLPSIRNYPVDADPVVPAQDPAMILPLNSPACGALCSSTRARSVRRVAPASALPRTCKARKRPKVTS